jgi:hypothetical protein
MFNYGYMVYQAERTRSPAEQRAADALLGQHSAALARLFRSLSSPARALRRQPGTSLPLCCPSVPMHATTAAEAAA